MKIKSLLTTKHWIIIIITLTTWLLWLNLLGVSQAVTKITNYWYITITMFFGSIIAGGTSLGGGAVAFPVFTKLLHIPPHEAKIFSLAIQSVGMSAASLTIYFSKIRVEWRVIFFGSIGGFIGILGGLSISFWFPTDIIKMSFTLMLTSFAVTLFIVNFYQQEKKINRLQSWGKNERNICLIAGIIGGIFSGLVGNGIDIILFSIMILAWRLSEKIATPTSVILMAINAIFGLFWQVFIRHDFPLIVQNYWFAAIPIVVIGAPLGAVICSNLQRQTIANILIVLILVELISSLLIIPLTPVIIITSLLSLIVFSILNYWLYQISLVSFYTINNKN